MLNKFTIFPYLSKLIFFLLNVESDDKKIVFD